MRRLIPIALVLIGVATMTDANAQKTMVTLGTATPGGGFPVYGDAVRRAINAADPTLQVEPRNTKGSAENIPLLEAGTIDIGLVQGEAAYEAFAGIGRAPANLKIVAAMYSSPGMFVVRADSPYRTIKDLVGKPVAFGARGSGLVILARYVLDGLGPRSGQGFPGDLSRPRRRWSGDGARRPRGRVVGRRLRLAGLHDDGAGAGRRALHRARRRTRLRIRAKHTFLKPLTIPAGSYPTQDRADRVGGLVELRPGAPDAR